MCGEGRTEFEDRGPSNSPCEENTKEALSEDKR